MGYGDHRSLCDDRWNRWGDGPGIRCYLHHRLRLMNIVQLVRRARLGADAIMPNTGSVSLMWTDEEMIDLVNEAYETLIQDFRLIRKKWGMRTVAQTDAAFAQEGETYTPSTSLRINTAGAAPQTLTLPPDFAQIVRILCISNRTVRFVPEDSEKYHWIDYEQGVRSTTTGIALSTAPDQLIFYYDLTGRRTLTLVPPTVGTYDLAVDYIPMLRPMYISSAGTVIRTNASATVTGTSTTFIKDNIFSEVSNQAAELMVGAWTGANPIQSTLWSMNTDYPRVNSVDSDTQVTLVSNFTGTTDAAGQNFILAMAPALPREYHRWISRYTIALMLQKVSPDLSMKSLQLTQKLFVETIQPAARVRQSQDSTVTEDAEEMGSAMEF